MTAGRIGGNPRVRDKRRQFLKTIEKINKTKSLFFEGVKKIDKDLTRLTRKKRERTQINKIRNKRREITTNTAEIQKP